MANRLSTAVSTNTNTVNNAQIISDLEKIAKIHDELNDYYEKEAAQLTKISDAYSNLSQINTVFLTQQEDILENFDSQTDRVEDLNKLFVEMTKHRDKILKYQKEETDILTGATKVQARLNAEFSKHIDMANEFKKNGATMFSPTMVQPFLKAIENLQSKLISGSEAYKQRTLALEKQRKKLMEEGKTTELAMLNLTESAWFKTFESIEGMLGAFYNVLKVIISKAIDFIKKMFSMLSDLAFDFAKNFPELILSITKSAFIFQKVMLEYTHNITQSIVAIPLNILEKAQELGYEIKKEMAEFAQNYENLQKDFQGSSLIGKGLANLQNGLISARKEFMNVNTEAVHLFGRGIQGINKALTESSDIVKSLGVFSSIFSDQIIKNKENLFYYYKMKQTFNLADDDMQYLARQATISGQSIATIYDQIEKSITGAAKIHHQDAKQMSRDYLDMRKNIVDFGHISNRELGNVVARTRQMGVEVKEAANMFQKLQTFEDAANMASQLSQGFNMVVDSMALLKAESPDQILQMLRDSMFATGRSFNQLNRFEKSLLQQQTGLSAEAMQALFEYQNLGKSYEQVMQEMEANDPTKLQLQSMQQLRDTVVEMKEVMPKFQNSFEAFFSGLKDNVLLSSSLRSNLSALSFTFDDLYNLGLSKNISSFNSALNSIFTVINNIKKVITSSAFVTSLGKISDNIATIIDQLFSFSSIDISTNIQNIITEIEPIFEDIFKIGLNFVSTGLQIFFKSLPHLFKLLTTQITNFFGPSGILMKELLPVLKTSANALITEITNPSNRSNIIASFKSIFSFTKEFLVIGADIAKSIISGITSDLSKGLAGSTILTEFKGLFDSIFDLLLGKNTLMSPGGRGPTRRAGGLIKQLLGFDSSGKLDLSSAQSIIGGIWDTLYPIFTDLTKELSFLLVDLTDWLNSTLSGIASNKSFFTTLFSTGSTDWSTIFSNIAQAFQNFLIGPGGTGGGILDSLLHIADQFVNYLRTSVTSPTGVQIDLVSAFTTIVKKVFDLYYMYYSTIYSIILKEFILKHLDKLMLVATGLISAIMIKMQLYSNLIKNSISSGGREHTAVLNTAFETNIKLLSSTFTHAGQVVAQKIATAMGGKPVDFAGNELSAINNTNSPVQAGTLTEPKTKFANLKAGLKGPAGLALGLSVLQGVTSGDMGQTIGSTVGSLALGALGTAFLGPMGGYIGAMAGSALGGFAGSMFDDGYISKDGKIVKVNDNDHIMAMKENGPIMKGLSSQGDMEEIRKQIAISESKNNISLISQEISRLKDSMQSIGEGLKNQNQKIELNMNGSKVGEALLSSGLTTMMSNPNITKNNPSLKPEGMSWRDGQIPSDGHLNSFNRV